jgi:hypothetical protein
MIGQAVTGTGPTRRRSLRWRTALACAALALWLPSVIATLLNHQVRRFWEDFWFWPGTLPGNALLNDYNAAYGYFALGSLVVWSLISRRWPRSGVLGAGVHGTLSALYVCALAAM